MIETLLTILKFPWSALLYFNGIFSKAWNLIRRPKLTIKFESKKFEFVNDNKEERHITIPYIAIANFENKTIQINSNFLLDGNQYMAGSEILKNLYTERFKEKLIQNFELMYSHYIDNYFEICQNRSFINIKQGDTKIFPLMRHSSSITNFFSRMKGSRLFGSNKKMSIQLSVNGYDVEYGLCRMNFYEQYLNYLAGVTARNSIKY